MKKILIITQLIFIICVSCTSNKIISKGYELPIVLNKIKTALVDTTFFQTSSVISLESNDSSLIRSIDRICTANNTFFLLDRSLHKVFIYTDSGKYLGQINDVGSGPGEYIQISDICVDKERENIVLLCDRPYKIMYYTYQGKLVREASYSDYYSEFAISNNNIYCYKIGEKNVDYLLSYTYPMKFVKQEALHERPYFDSGSSGTLAFFGVGNRITMSDAVYFTRPFENFIYTIKNNEIYEEYEIDFKDHLLPQSLLEKKMSSRNFLDICDKNKYVCSITNIVGNDDYLLFNTNIGFFIYDKHSQSLNGYQFILNSALSGGTPNYLPVNNSSHIVQVVQPSQFKQYIDSRKKREKNLDKLESAYKDIYQKLDEEDNPILIVYKLPHKNNATKN